MFFAKYYLVNIICITFSRFIINQEQILIKDRKHEYYQNEQIADYMERLYEHIDS
jgi:hypothetical protein